MVRAPETCIVRLIQPTGGFNVGERASFDLNIAKNMILAKAAVLDDKEVDLAQLAIDEEEHNEETSDGTLLKMSATDADGFIKRVEDIEELKRLWEGERRNPKHDGGRKGVLVMLRQRAHELENPQTEE